MPRGIRGALCTELCHRAGMKMPEGCGATRGSGPLRATPGTPRAAPPCLQVPWAPPGPWLLQPARNKGASCGAKDARPGLRESPGGRWRRLLGNASGFGGDSLSRGPGFLADERSPESRRARLSPASGLRAPSSPRLLGPRSPWHYRAS